MCVFIIFIISFFQPRLISFSQPLLIPFATQAICSRLQRYRPNFLPYFILYSHSNPLMSQMTFPWAASAPLKDENCCSTSCSSPMDFE